MKVFKSKRKLTNFSLFMSLFHEPFFLPCDVALYDASK